MTLILVLETPFVGAALLGFSGFLLFSRKLYISYKLLLINVGTQFMCFQSFCSLKIPMCGRDWKRTQLAGQVCSHLLGPWQTVWAFQDCTRRESIHITTHTCPRLSSTFHFQYLEDQDEALGPGPKWKTHSSRFLQSSSSSCKELPDSSFLVSLR